MFTLAIILAISAVYMLVEFTTAPEGWQDCEGYHSGKVASPAGYGSSGRISAAPGFAEPPFHDTPNSTGVQHDHA